MTNPLVLGDFATAFGATDSSADIQEGLRNERAIEVRWRDDVLTKNGKYVMILAKAAGRSMDDAPEDLASDLQEGRLPHHILAEIAKLKGKCKEFVLARLVSKKDDPSFKERFGTMSSIAVGKIGSLTAAYPAIKNNITSWKEIDKKDRTWILLAALYYDAPVTLQRIDVDDPAPEDHADNAEDEGAQVTVCDASRAMDVTQHQYFMEDADMVGCISSCIRGADVTLDACSMVREKVVAMTNQLMKRLERKLLSLPKNVRHNFVWAACHDKMY